MNHYDSMTVTLQDGNPVIVGPVPKWLGVDDDLLNNLDPQWGDLSGETLTLLGHRFNRIGRDPAHLSVTIFELVTT